MFKKNPITKYTIIMSYKKKIYWWKYVNLSYASKKKAEIFPIKYFSINLKSTVL